MKKWKILGGSIAPTGSLSIQFIPGPARFPEIQPEAKDKRKHRTAGHFIDNVLKSNGGKEPDLFEGMLPDTKNKIRDTGAKIEFINRKGEGIKLSKGKYRLLLCLSKLLHDKSQNTDTDAEDYYAGNKGVEMVHYKTPQGDITLRSSKVALTLYDIAKDFYAGESIGGENVKTVAKLLYELADNPDDKCLIRYTRTEKIGKIDREYFIESYESMVRMATVGYKDLLNGKKIDEKREIVIGLHPIFTDQIAHKYVELPPDLTRRMIESNGSSNISEICTLFVLELSRAHSNRKHLSKDQDKNPLYEIGVARLYDKIAPGYRPPNKSRPSLLEKYFQKAIKTAKDIRLLLSYTTKPGKTGEMLYVFTLSKNWE